MSAVMHQEGDSAMQVSHDASQDELSDVDVDGDGSSSLSDIEDKDPDEQEDEDDISNDSEANDSEAETERLEDSPNKLRKHQDVVLSAGSDSQIYERSPSKLKHQTTLDTAEDDEEDEPLSEVEDDEDNNSDNESVKSSERGELGREAPTTAATTMEDSSSEGKKSLSVNELDSKKRKRSIMAGSGLDLEEPLRKRTGSVMTPGDEYAIDDEEIQEEGDTSNPISGNISVDEDAEAREEAEEVVADEEIPEPVELPPLVKSPKKRGRKKKKVVENGAQNHDYDPDTVPNGEVVPNGEDETKAGDEDNVDPEADDEAEAAQKNEEERT